MAATAEITHNSKGLAVFGGKPVRAAPMPPRNAFGDAEFAMVRQVFEYYRERQIDPGYQGPFEQRYCAAFADYMGGGYADAVATGTAAVFIALAALGLPKGSEVICSPITDPGSVNAIIMNGLVPRLADARPGSYNMGSAEFEARISPSTSAVLVVHSAGQATDVDNICAIAKKRGVRVVEDCSQAHGARLNGKLVGTFGDIAAFSTMYRKASITGASGGVVYTQDLDLYHMALAHADRGKTPWIKGFDDKDPASFIVPALNWHTDEISCAVGLSSMGRLPETIRNRLAYVRGLDRLTTESKICSPIGWTEGDSPFIYPILVDVDAIRCTKEEFARAVLAEGIGLNPHYKYLVADWHWLFEKCGVERYEPVQARRVRDRSFVLFLNEKYGPQEVEDTIAAILKVERVMQR